MLLWIAIPVSLIAIVAIAAALFVRTAPFGRLPRGERLARIERSPNYRDGEFRNRRPVPMMTSRKGVVRTVAGSLLRSRRNVSPPEPVATVRTDLQTLDPQSDLLVWFGHSSLLLQRGGRRFLVDPVFCSASPVPFINRPFAGTDTYRPDDMPAIDFLLITHDHWDHLDCRTVVALRDRTAAVICPLGVGEHFERWGFAPERIVEMDWDECVRPEAGVAIYCLPAQHFSGRGPKRNKTLWASFLVECGGSRTYIAGDGGYAPHFAEIGRRFPNIDLAVMENGQYSPDWRYIHMMPEYMERAARETGARRILTVHHSKYALSTHPWDEPLRNEEHIAGVVPARIGEVVRL